MIAILVCVVSGTVARVLIPFLHEWRANPDVKFDKKFVVPPILAIVMTLIGVPLLLPSIPPELASATALSLSQIGALFLIGWGGTDLLREGQKLVIGPPKSS